MTCGSTIACPTAALKVHSSVTTKPLADLNSRKYTWIWLWLYMACSVTIVSCERTCVIRPHLLIVGAHWMQCYNCFLWENLMCYPAPSFDCKCTWHAVLQLFLDVLSGPSFVVSYSCFMSSDGIREKDKNSLGTILQQVGTLNRDNSYTLARCAWAEVRQDWQFYTEQDRVLLKK